VDIGKGSNESVRHFKIRAKKIESRSGETEFVRVLGPWYTSSDKISVYKANSPLVLEGDICTSLFALQEFRDLGIVSTALRCPSRKTFIQ